MDADKGILTRIEQIFRRDLDNESICLDYQTVAADIEEWDSLAHAQLMFAIENEFGISFLTSEIKNFKNVGDIVELVKQKVKK